MKRYKMYYFIKKPTYKYNLVAVLCEIDLMDNWMIFY